jgi:transcriptional regulator with XRE-family HTH domain
VSALRPGARISTPDSLHDDIMEAQPMGEQLGDLLRAWRQRRRTSQLDLALDAGISARHLSFVETGRARPSREVVLRLAEQLAVPLRERNRLLVAAGFAPVFEARPLDHPSLGAAKAAVDRVLAGHEPYPAIAVDRHWTLVAANAALTPLLHGVARSLLEPPVNVLRIGLHPDGLAPRILNLREWRAHLLARLHGQHAATGDATIAALAEELRGYPVPEAAGHGGRQDLGGIAVPLRLRTAAGELAFLSTTMVFGTALDLTLAELAIEAFFPADAATAMALRAGAG